MLEDDKRQELEKEKFRVPLTVPEIQQLLLTMLDILTYEGEVTFVVHKAYEVSSIRKLGADKAVVRFKSGETFKLTVEHC